ncbi:hypothetical protein MYP_1129 [Sporocytophaga myxococcoides]|uniref:CD-NTase-associated protein 12/Pycsar effector protein TIR domain-containing protein n=1 Tax=Sporocytophaga myxococcoides TaxID=153721 RepID=A0A098LAE3_9BACT|nr:hypothetical protein [Sporocytophaga myxococcoides]GAL83901.1 hypothetical protein MYP_1129 [Sporocytophaga myxococcoides]
MNTLIFFSISSGENFQYENTLLSSLKEQLTITTFFDFDNHSEGILFGYFSRILEENKKEDQNTMVIIEASESTTKGVIPFCETLLKSKDYVKAILIGEHAIVEKMLASLKSFNKVKNPDAQDLIALIQSSISNESASR